jgi:hypothetical protein
MDLHKLLEGFAPTVQEWYRDWLLAISVPTAFAEQGKHAASMHGGDLQQLTSAVVEAIHVLDRKGHVLQVCQTSLPGVLKLVEKSVPYCQCFCILGIPATETEPGVVRKPDIYCCGDISLNRRFLSWILYASTQVLMQSRQSKNPMLDLQLQVGPLPEWCMQAMQRIAELQQTTDSGHP